MTTPYEILADSAINGSKENRKERLSSEVQTSNTPYQPLPQSHGEVIAARIDELPSCKALWSFIALLSLGGFFELFDLFQSAYISPGLIGSHIFAQGNHGVFGFSDQAAFTAATFLGLFAGASLLSALVDRFGRRSVFTIALIWYSIMSVLMAVQTHALGVIGFRFMVGIGLGVELVTIDAYLTECVPTHMRNKAFAFAFAIQFLSVPCVALMSWLLVPHAPMGIAGWRWVVLMSAAFALIVWWCRKKLPESPRWLAEHGYYQTADNIMSEIEAKCGIARKDTAKRPEHHAVSTTSSVCLRASTQTAASTVVPKHNERNVSMWQAPYRNRVILLVVFNIFQAIGFFGFGNWLPALLSNRGTAITHSLLYAFFITLAYPLGSIMLMKVANRVENKWQIVLASLGTVIFGTLFAYSLHPIALIVTGFMVTLSTAWMTYAFHAYQTELFPTAIRARAVGFCYSFSRISTVFSSILIATILSLWGATSVIAFIVISMLIVMLTIAFFGPLTRGRSLESISE
ncbi:Inner membrane metabolite transport protein YdjE [Halomonadaceae bacterium LMG 33818]|uniref:MFS transporter n=1 Tax=Cernens ardua TaxID=3402176 RepID=UPI003EDBB9A4